MGSKHPNIGGEIRNPTGLGFPPTASGRPTNENPPDFHFWKKIGLAWVFSIQKKSYFQGAPGSFLVIRVRFLGKHTLSWEDFLPMSTGLPHFCRFMAHLNEFAPF